MSVAAKKRSDPRRSGGLHLVVAPLCIALRSNVVYADVEQVRRLALAPMFSSWLLPRFAASREATAQSCAPRQRPSISDVPRDQLHARAPSNRKTLVSVLCGLTVNWGLVFSARREPVHQWRVLPRRGTAFIASRVLKGGTRDFGGSLNETMVRHHSQLTHPRAAIYRRR